MSGSYCPLPWIGINVLPGGIVAPCCQWSGEFQSIGSEITHQSQIVDLFNGVRQDMLLGKEIKGCFQCLSAERAGARSRRQEVIDQYGVVNTTQTRIIDINFDNVCNLKCRGCCSASSHLWFTDELEIYGKTFADKKYQENEFQIDFSNLEVLNVSGGEPFLSKSFDNLADDLINQNVAQQIRLIVSSNGTIKPSNKLYKLFLEVKHLNLNISIDGIGHLNTYFRSGADFQECLETIEFLKNLKDLRGDKTTALNIHTTVSIYNVNLLGEIRDYFKLNFPEYTTSHRILYWPQQLCIRHLPIDLKDLVKPFVETLGNDYIDVINELNASGEDYFQHFLNFHSTLDKIRNESLEHSNPLLSDYIKKHKHNNQSKTFFLKQMDLLKCGM